MNKITKTPKMVQITLSLSPYEIVHTLYGNLYYDDWLHREANRITSNGDRIAEIRNRNSLISLWVDDISNDKL